MNYLQLVQEFVSELGIAGANNAGTLPTTTVGQTGQLRRAVQWIAQANNDLNVMYTDWDFLEVDYSETLVVGTRTAPVHSGVNETVKKFDRDSFNLDRGLATHTPLSFVDWRAYRRELLPGAHSVNQRPSIFSIRPRDNLIYFDEPPDQAYTLTATFWKRPVLISGDSAVPDIPEDFHRLIILTAGVKYANKEDAPEIIQGWEAEYTALLSDLESDQLPGREFDNMSGQDVDLTMDIPDSGDYYGERR